MSTKFKLSELKKRSQCSPKEHPQLGNSQLYVFLFQKIIFCNQNFIYFYEVTCPKCGEVHQFSEKDLMEGSKPCSKCGELLEFEFDEDDEDDSEEMPF